MRVPILLSRCLVAFAFTLSSGHFVEAVAETESEPGVDIGTRPGDDFFQFANGAWLKATTIPESDARWGARNEINALTARQVLRLLEDASQAPKGSEARKIADFRSAYLDVDGIERQGRARLEPQLKSIAQLRDKLGLTRWLAREMRADADPVNAGTYNSSHVLGLALQSGLHGETVYVAYLVQGGLGLGDREAYLSNDPKSQVLREKYRAGVAHVLHALGIPSAQADRRAAAVLALETALAGFHATREASANERNADTLWSRSDFAREAPGLNWQLFFSAAGLDGQRSFVPWQPGAVKGLAALVAGQPLQAWQDYLRVRTVAHYADVLPDAFSVDPLTPNQRVQRAVEATQSALSELIGKEYVRRHFPPEHKARVQAIVADVVAAFSRHVEAAAWLSPEAGATALKKLKSLEFGVGYPDRWRSAPEIEVDPGDAVGNLMRVARRDRERALARVGKPVDRSEWFIAPQLAGAVLTFNENSYSFAAALLQAPKFDAAASEAANYGSIGAIVGHEVSHFVDTLGRDYDADGRLKRWWSEEDAANYERMTEPLVRQFSGYRPFPDVAVDGKLGLVENLADLGGLAAAFDAHRRALGTRAQDRAFVRAQDRAFFIAFARAWRIKYRDDALKAQARTDHAPENFRVSTVRNMDAWYDAFDVKPGDRLYLEPQARVKGW